MIHFNARYCRRQTHLRQSIRDRCLSRVCRPELPSTEFLVYDGRPIHRSWSTGYILEINRRNRATAAEESIRSRRAVSKIFCVIFVLKRGTFNVRVKVVFGKAIPRVCQTSQQKASHRVYTTWRRRSRRLLQPQTLPPLNTPCLQYHPLWSTMCLWWPQIGKYILI